MISENNFRISIITINYNGAPFIERCIKSILGQSYDNWEHIIVDCGSTDNSLAKLRLLTHSKLIIKENDFCSVSEGRNLAISYSTGHLCAILDIDDFALPNRLLDQVNLFKNDRNLICVGGDFHANINRNGFFKKLFFSKSKLFEMPSSHREMVTMLNLGLNPIVHSTLMFDKSAFDAIKGYRNSMEKSEDFDLVLRFSRVGKLGSSPTPVSELYFGVPNSHTVRHKPQGMGPLHFVFLSLIENLDYPKKNISHTDILLFLVRLPENVLSGLQSKLILSILLEKVKLSRHAKRIFYRFFFRNLLSFFSVVNDGKFKKINNLQEIATIVEGSRIRGKL